MSEVTFTLIKENYAPWGLFAESAPEQIVVWLTPENPVCLIDSILLSETHIEISRHSQAAGIISITGLPDENKDSFEALPKSEPVSQFAQNLVGLMKKDIEVGNEQKFKALAGNPEVDKVLSMPVGKLKKELKRIAKEDSPASFFRECRSKEAEGKNRKTVIAVLVDIIQKKIKSSEHQVRSHFPGFRDVISEQYYNSIEEYEDEDEDE